MPEVTFVDGERRVTVAGRDGESIMAAAIQNRVDGIIGECGGAMSCATCHVYVDDHWFAQIPPADDEELEMLAEAKAPRQSTSRLSCQIELGAGTDGIVVLLPEEQ